ncbi:hypothetical protein N7G274_003685 [Stereocaulon virgatum]|uniref:C2H2-type domain-containing protein n=1 Tax=Stereocaulon virgatum TaxID=373712 RepID=A0ABR4AC00_9LECA
MALSPVTEEENSTPSRSGNGEIPDIAVENSSAARAMWCECHHRLFLCQSGYARPDILLRHSDCHHRSFDFAIARCNTTIVGNLHCIFASQRVYHSKRQQSRQSSIQLLKLE